MTHKIDFAKKTGVTDEWFTPENAIYPILKYIKPESVVWCPFDTDESNFVKILKEQGHNVINTHIEDGYDFFETSVECDYIISNPPYSIRNDILARMFSLEKPFMMLMNTNGLFDSKIRWKLFNDNNFSLIYLSGRVNYMKSYGAKEKSSPPFQSAYICSKISNDKILFEEK